MGCAPLENSEPGDGRTIFTGVSLSSVANAGEIEVSAEVVDLTNQELIVASDVAVSVETATPLTVSAEHSEWEMASSRATFTGGVVATRGLFTIECNLLVVEYSSDGNVESASATGGVRLTRGDWSGTAGSASLNLVDGVVTLTGDSLIEGGGNRLQGSTIRVYMTSERVECDDCSMVVLTPELD